MLCRKNNKILRPTTRAHWLRRQALREYGAIVKNRQYPQAGRLRANMGNIYYEQVGPRKLSIAQETFRHKVSVRVAIVRILLGNLVSADKALHSVIEILTRQYFRQRSNGGTFCASREYGCILDKRWSNVRKTPFSRPPLPALVCHTTFSSANTRKQSRTTGWR